MPNLQIVAIVGSFAKTSTKDMLYTLLWKDFRVVKTPKSYNTEISIARTVLSDLKKNTEIFIVEMDAYHPGDIQKLCQLVNPTLGVITSIAPQHLQRFGTMEKLASSQFELADYLSKEELLVLNSHSEWILKLQTDYSNNKAFYGERTDDQFRAESIKQTNEGLRFKLITPVGQTEIELPLFGEHHIQNFLAAAALALNLGLSLKQIQKRAQFILPTPHRLEVKKQGMMTIIDNTYNTNPVSARSSLALLKQLKGGEKIVITPGLVELGTKHYRENVEFAKSAAEVSDKIIIVGKHAQEPLQTGLQEAHYPGNKTFFVPSTQAALSLLPQIAQSESVVLLENDLPDQYN